MVKRRPELPLVCVEGNLFKAEQGCNYVSKYFAQDEVGNWMNYLEVFVKLYLKLDRRTFTYSLG